eukprot:scaffold14655_cov31-Tisochrysis_lutea.AAC.4
MEAHWLRIERREHVRHRSIGRPAWLRPVPTGASSFGEGTTRAHQIQQRVGFLEDVRSIFDRRRHRRNGRSAVVGPHGIRMCAGLRREPTPRNTRPGVQPDQPRRSNRRNSLQRMRMQ